jgi:phage tail sheath protein FI
VKVLNPAKSVFGSGDQLVVPPSGIVASVFARTDSAQPGGVYDPHAGIEAGRMFGVLGFETAEVLEENKRDLVYPHRINPLTTGPGLPRYIDGSRTLKGDGNFPYVAERRHLHRALAEAGAPVRAPQEQHRGAPRAGAAHHHGLPARADEHGAFRSKTPSAAFFVYVSEQLNTSTVIFAGKLIARVGLATNKPAELIILRISQDMRALEAELAAGEG